MLHVFITKLTWLTMIFQLSNIVIDDLYTITNLILGIINWKIKIIALFNN